MLKTTFRLLAMASCLTFAIGLPVFAVSQIELPKSIEPAATLDAKHDQKITSAGYSDSWCGDSCCDGETASGKAVCCSKRVTKEVKKHCWKVKSEMICIPGFRFQCNWKKRSSKSCDCGDTCCSNVSCTDCPPKCGRVRCINVLEKHEYTCEKCGYEWEVKCVRTDKSCSRSGGDDCPSCGTTGN